MLLTQSSPRVRSALVAAVSVLATSLATVAGASTAHAGEPPAVPTLTPAVGSALSPTADNAFRIATFNILGSQHTRGRGGYGPGVQRARLTTKIIKAQHIDVIGMQEVQRDQLRVLNRKLPGFDIWPNKRLGGGGLRLQIAYRTAQFKLLKTGKIMTAFDRQRRPVPWVLLRDRSTGRKLHVINFHNSARNLEHERDSATRREIKLIKKLRARGPAVFAVGDTNEHSEWFCAVRAKTDLVAPQGGSATSKKKCNPPEGRLLIDWIMGGGPMSFLNTGWLSGGLVGRASDHNLVHATVRMRPLGRSGPL